MIRDILTVQKRELAKRFEGRYVPRTVKSVMGEHDLVVVILGPRRAGKSFLAMHLIHSKKTFGHVNFDDERLVGLADYDELIAAVDFVYDSPRDLLLDEIQNVDRWELLVNRLQRQGRRLVVTGSNAHLLSSELATHLTGRHLPMVLFPFSFAEYASAVMPANPATQPEYKECFISFLQNGGYPEPLLKGVDRTSYLSALLESIIYKDIAKRFKIRSIAAIEDLVRYLLSNIGSEYSYRTLSAVTKCKSVHTVIKYLRYLEEAFLCFSLRRFSFKVREQATANRKIYCIDNGFITTGAFGVSGGSGRLAENAVAVKLHKQELDGDGELFFWKNTNHHEVDFVVVRNRNVQQLIQVCWNIDNPDTKNREIRALVLAGEALKCSNLLLLTENTDKTESVTWFDKKAEIRYVPLWKWMLDEKSVSHPLAGG